MNITVFTSNQPRHISLIENLAGISETVFAVVEANTVFSGEVKDFYPKSEKMKDYFQKMRTAEKRIFGNPRFLPGNARAIVLKSGDLNKLPYSQLSEALKSDFYVVFGSSFIKGELCDFLVSKRAVNIHMGISPYYRGSSCNFWALYDNRPEYVGATIHLLSAGLDSGPILYHAFPPDNCLDSFDLGMKAVKSAHLSLIKSLKSKKIWRFTPVKQNKNLEFRYSRANEFTEEIVTEFLEKKLQLYTIQKSLLNRDMRLFLQPFVLK